jgi:hypothetical protein
MRAVTCLLFVAMSFCDIAATDLLAVPLEIEGTKIATEGEARHFAFKQYVEQMKGNILAEETVRIAAIIKLGYDLPGFANKGELIWDTRLLTLENELRGIIWVHPNTKKVRFVTGVWDQTKVDTPQKATQ